MKRLVANRDASKLQVSHAFGRSLSLVSLLTLAACSGGGGASVSSGPTTQTGVFVDSPVQGLAWATGGVSGETSPSGQFSFESGAEVQFYVGDILVGSATGATVLTPIDFVAGATDETDDTVTNICRFLQTLDADQDPSNGILITSQAQTAAEGLSINFAQSPDDFTNDAGSTIGTITSNPLVTAAAAQEHFSGTLLNNIAGVYNGSFSGEDAGAWQFVALPDGSIHGWGYSFSDGDEEPFALQGTLSTDGSTDVAGSAGGGATFSGAVSGNAISGTWTGDGDGTFQGSRVSAAAADLPPELMTQIVGGYTGTVFGDEIEPLTVEVDSSGSMIFSIPGEGAVAWSVITSTTSSSAVFVGSADDSESIQGTVGTDGTLEGTWQSSFYGESGTFTAQKD